MITHHREGEQGTLEAVPRLRRQHGVATCTPCTNARTVAIYKPARLRSIEIPTEDDWLRFFASCGSDFEFLCELIFYLKAARRSGWRARRVQPDRLAALLDNTQLKNDSNRTHKQPKK